MQQIQKYLVGAALVAALPTLIPIYQKTMMPALVQGRRLVNSCVKESKILALKAKYELEDIWLEAQYDQMQKQFEQKAGESYGQFFH